MQHQPATSRLLRSVLTVVVTLAVAGGALAAELSDAELQNRRCFNCHGQRHIVDLDPHQRAGMVAGSDQALPEQTGVRPGLFVAPDALRGSVHESVACVACHTDAAELPHRARLDDATCNTACHVEQGAAFRRGVHAQALAAGDVNAPHCTDCHGGHDILPSASRASRTHPLNIVQSCGDCHAQHRSELDNGKSPGAHVQDYLESVHGRALVKAGLAVAATCADCHGYHDVRASDDAESATSRVNVPETCGKCHIGINETFQASVHGANLANGDAPVCTDCHAAHSISRSDTRQFERDLVNECGACHNKPPRDNPNARTLYETYRMSYHGQVTRLGSDRAARCSDCHGAHDIQPSDDPASRLYGLNRIETCAKCHPGANANFAAFHPHADFRDGSRFPLLNGIWWYFIVLMSVTFSFWGLHTAAWFARSIVERIKHGPHPKPRPAAYAIARFKLIDRVNHALIIITFFGLTLTGMPLFFSDKPWAAMLAGAFGGIQACGVLHRVFAVMLIGNVVVHLFGLINRARRTSIRNIISGPNSMVPRWKDVQDFKGMLAWFFRGKAKPRFDHFTYWEKFDYWAEVFGTAVIGGTGLMLWFPELFARVMPGWMFNVAVIVHGYEALLAVGFIFSIHFFNAHLRLEKFPVDDVIFTGQLPEDEFAHERGEEYDRLKAAGTLETLRVPTRPAHYRVLAVLGGVLAMLVGSAMVLLIILAGLGIV